MWSSTRLNPWHSIIQVLNAPIRSDCALGKARIGCIKSGVYFLCPKDVCVHRYLLLKTKNLSQKTWCGERIRPQFLMAMSG